MGRRLLELLRPFDFEVLLHDPYVSEPEAAALGAQLVTLETLLSRSDIVSLHAPDLPETHRMLDAPRLALIRDGGVLINTSRGALIDQEALTQELIRGRLQAVLDVTTPEPLPPTDPLYDLPNVFLTPHIAGSLGNELSRLGHIVTEELERVATNSPLKHAVTQSDMTRVA